MDGRQSGMTLRSFKNGIHMPRRRLQGGRGCCMEGCAAGNARPFPAGTVGADSPFDTLMHCLSAG